MNILEIKNLTKHFGEKTVLENVSMCFEAGKTTCIMGASGCGKTTLLRILAGLETPDSGEIIRHYKDVSFVFQEDRLCEDFSPISNIRFVTGKQVKEEEIIRHLNSLGLVEHLKSPVRTMSGGMKRRVALARALSVPYDFLILDEPFKGLDEKLKLSVIGYLRAATKGKTVLCVTHDWKEAELLGDTVLQMKM